MNSIEFEKALYKGLGRCVTELDLPGRTEVHKKTVLDCCTKNISSYFPLEKSRGEFLYRLVKKFNDDKYFLRPVNSVYVKELPRCENTYKMLIQMMDFLWLFKKENNIAVYDILLNKFSTVKEELCTSKENFFAKDFFEIMCLKFIENEGFDGYAYVIRAIDVICKENDNYVLDDFCSVLDVGKKRFRAKKILQETFSHTSRKMYNYFYISYRKALQAVPEYDNREKLAECCFDVNEVCAETVRIMQKGEEAREEQIFKLCKKIIALHEVRQKKRIPKELLFFAYEYSPSSNLRMKIVSLMGKKRIITKEIAEEAVNDCEEKTRKYIKQYHAHLLV
ncbi:MAG: hypothetical protein E7387_04920 [Ruminococcaceae bacterium]|nr:hypothetical protein [Oscillospiraceae bacterium]